MVTNVPRTQPGNTVWREFYDDKDEPFKTYCVIEFSYSCPQSAIEWLISKIVSKREHGGANLWLKVASKDDQRDTIAYVGASTVRLLVAAEMMEIRKKFKDGTPRELNLKDIEHYQGGDNLDTFLTTAEKSRIVMHELEGIRAGSDDTHLPGAPNIDLYEGLALIPHCVNEGLIQQIFPLHNKTELEEVSQAWYKEFWKSQPIGKIRNYFGETVAMYFAFLGFYTTALIPLACLAICSFLFELGDIWIQWFFCIFNMIWVTVFIEAWKRHSSVLAYRWGTYDLRKFEEARPQYFGVLGKNSVTGRIEPVYPKWKRAMRFYLISVPVMLLCLAYAGAAMVCNFWLQDMADNYYEETGSLTASLLTFVPTVGYPLVIVISNIIYYELAKVLNDFENHRLQSSYENHFIIKLVLFYSFNSFCALFYTAFWLQDIDKLRRSLGSLLITSQVVNQFVEVLVPFATYFVKTYLKQKQSGEASPTVASKLSLATIQQVEDESLKGNYTDVSDSHKQPAVMAVFNDYLEMYLQFGYVFLFSAVFPTAALWALLNNVIEIRSDAFKLCSSFQRPFAKPCEGIGAWLYAFEAMNVLAVITNTVLIAISPAAREWRSDSGDATFFVTFIIIEHILILVKTLLAFAIPDQPGWVHHAIARTEYQAKQTWMKERLELTESMTQLLGTTSSGNVKKNQ